MNSSAIGQSELPWFQRRSRLKFICVLLALAVALGSSVSFAKGNKGNGKGSPGKGQAEKGKGKPGAGKKKGKGKGNHGKGKKGQSGGGGGGPSTGSVVKADVLNWITANNPGLSGNFLNTEPPDRGIKLPNGQTVPIYKTKQFLDVNFRLTFYVRVQQKGDNVVPEMEERLRKLMAHPNFYHRVLEHRPQYKISPKGMVSAQEAYNHFRNINRHLSVTADEKFKAPVGGGGGIAAPSWAVWKAMNIFLHEACHCIGIGHDSGGLSGPIAGSMRDWDRKKLWNYDTIDLNSLAIPN